MIGGWYPIQRISGSRCVDRYWVDQLHHEPRGKFFYARHWLLIVSATLIELPKYVLDKVRARILSNYQLNEENELIDQTFEKYYNAYKRRRDYDNAYYKENQGNTFTRLRVWKKNLWKGKLQDYNNRTLNTDDIFKLSSTVQKRRNSKPVHERVNETQTRVIGNRRWNVKDQLIKVSDEMFRYPSLTSFSWFWLFTNFVEGKSRPHYSTPGLETFWELFD